MALVVVIDSVVALLSAAEAVLALAAAGAGCAAGAIAATLAASREGR